MPVNLIPKRPGRTPSYWCTWSTQNYGRIGPVLDPKQYEGDQGARLAREAMNEQMLFGPGAWSDQFPRVRGDLFLLLDDGWDVPPGIHPNARRDAFGALTLDEGRFPSFTGDPANRLRMLNEAAKAAGWRGAGLWIAAQQAGSGHQDDFDPAVSEGYYRERARWCRDAGIDYWKVDWGTHAHTLRFRQLMTEAARLEHPDLIVEHAFCSGPVNGYGGDAARTSRFADWEGILEGSREVMRFSDVFRSYDVTAQLSAATTLDRLSALLACPGGLVNCEDEVYIGAALGCALGVMRSSFWHRIEGYDYDPFELRSRTDEVTRAVRWQRIAPAFSGGTINASGRLLTDAWRFEPGQTWLSSAVGHRLLQSAPAVLARNMPLPKVDMPEGGEPPFVAASMNPSGALTITALPRTREDHAEMPLADISLKAGRFPAALGVFGEYRSVHVRAAEDVSSLRLFAQDLAQDQGVEITSMVVRSGEGVVFPGTLAQALSTKRDASAPGFVVRPLR